MVTISNISGFWYRVVTIVFVKINPTGSIGEPVNRQNNFMPGKQRSINARLIEYVCECGQGVYRLKVNSPYTSDCRHTWLHACTGCENELEFTVPYPWSAF
jgi:hypothetical protein